MNSRLGTLFATVLLATACGTEEGVHRGTDIGPALINLTGQLEGEVPENLNADLLRAALVWVNIPQEAIDCMNEVSGPLSFACLAFDELTPALASESVVIEPVTLATFDVPLRALPPPSVLVGDSDQRMGFASLVVFEDLNGNGDLDFVGPTAEAAIDAPVAGQLHPDGLPLSVVVYREGQLSPLWEAFAGAGCGEPEQGFSLLTLEGDGESLPTCTVTGTDESTIGVTFDLTEDTKRMLVCHLTPEMFSTYPSVAPPAGAVVDCNYIDQMVFTAYPNAYCAFEQTYELRGCGFDLTGTCSSPEWDLSSNPPSWWTCGNEFADGFSLTDNAAELTDGLDELFTVTFDQGTETYLPSALSVVLMVSQAEGYSVTIGDGVRHIDNDSNGLFSVGDSLEIYEPQDLFGPDVTTVGVGLVDGEDMFSTLAWYP